MKLWACFDDQIEASETFLPGVGFPTPRRSKGPLWVTLIEGPAKWYRRPIPNRAG